MSAKFAPDCRAYQCPAYVDRHPIHLCRTPYRSRPPALHSFLPLP